VQSLHEHDAYMTDIYKAFKIQPIALISYPILNDISCQGLLKKWRDDNSYLLGTHLHSWVTPPFEEELSNFNSFAGNLSFELREKKIRTLTEKFIEILGFQPLYYKCGRYGIVNSTYEILQSYHYQYDFSPFAKKDFSNIQGMDCSHIDNKPYFPPSNKTLKIFPITADYTGLAKECSFLHAVHKNSSFKKIKLQGLVSRLNILDFIALTPEGINETELKKLTKTLLLKGQKYFHFTYHSSSFIINQTPYSKSVQDIQIIRDRIKHYLEFFLEIGGQIVFNEKTHTVFNLTPDEHIRLKKNKIKG
jgi:hypothetical protein